MKVSSILAAQTSRRETLTLMQKPQAGQIPVVVVLEEQHLLVGDEHLNVFPRKLHRRHRGLVGPCCFEEGAFVSGQCWILVGELLTDDPAHRRLERCGGS